MQRFVSKRSSSSVDLDSSSLDDMRVERAAIALCVGLSWPLHKRRLSADAPAGSSCGNVLCMSTSSTTMSFRMVSACSGQAGGNRETPSSDRSPARRSPSSPPCRSGTKRRKIQVDPIVRDWFLDISYQWKTQRRWGMSQCLCEVQRLCPRMFDGINPNIPYRWERRAPRAAPLGRIILLSPGDKTRLSEHILRVTDVLCLSAVTIRGLVYE